VAAMNTLKVEEKQQENIFNKMWKALPKWHGTDKPQFYE
jgi:hypothetical protein